ncbi:hypothetical protein [Luteolibacter luteus]|uniref:Uncharacterized protein n=1 Tax=Luteolibacter luteus TaxID=2728835 RepID=A0A858RHB7_9BACT|nr:hypothetical protein [Luteolibacter luteus]QJE96566.1 hypothetical protein HHL09_12490 [Luteolibacter luteus]
MKPRHTRWLGVGLLVIAAGLTIWRPGRGSPQASAAVESARAAKSHLRGPDLGTRSERMERLRLVWASVSGGQADTDLSRLARELILSLPASVLKELLVEFVTTGAETGDPDWLQLMARRIGDLETERGLDWLVEQATATGEESSAFHYLIRDGLLGWSDSDPVGVLGAYFDMRKSNRFGMNERYDEGGGAKGIGAQIVAKASKQSPGETWEILRTWQGKKLAAAFFEGVDPAQAKYFASRASELFYDFAQPGLEHIGGSSEDWEFKGALLESSAGAVFAADREQGVAMYEKVWPTLGSDHDGVDGAKRDAKLGRRFFLESRQQALAWIDGHEPAAKQVLVGELAYGILSNPQLDERGYEGIESLKERLGTPEQQHRWLEKLRWELAARGAGPRRDHIVDQLAETLQLSSAERSLLVEPTDFE